MLKFRGTDKNTPGSIVLGFVLDESNIVKLMSGLPIEVHAKDMGVDSPVIVTIAYGGTAENMRELASRIENRFPDAEKKCQNKHHEG